MANNLPSIVRHTKWNFGNRCYIGDSCSHRLFSLERSFQSDDSSVLDAGYRWWIFSDNIGFNYYGAVAAAYVYVHIASCGNIACV